MHNAIQCFLYMLVPFCFGEYDNSTMARYCQEIFFAQAFLGVLQKRGQRGKGIKGIWGWGWGCTWAGCHSRC